MFRKGLLANDRRREKIIDEIEMKLLNWKEIEIPSREIGKNVDGELKGVDPMAYIRFASVYLDLNSIEEFKKLLVDFKEK